MSEAGDHLAIFPGAVRQQEVEQASFFAGFLLREQPLGIAREFEKLHAFPKQAAAGRMGRAREGGHGHGSRFEHYELPGDGLIRSATSANGVAP